MKSVVFLFIVVLSDFFFFSEPNMLNVSHWTDWIKHVSVSFMFHFVLLLRQYWTLKSQERMLIFVASTPEMAKINQIE